MNPRGRAANGEPGEADGGDDGEEQVGESADSRGVNGIDRVRDARAEPLLTRVVSAHVMGGCAMSDNVRLGIVSSKGRYHGLANLSVHDGSLFPTSIGANPQLSIYGITAKLASTLANELTGKPAPKPNAV